MSNAMFSGGQSRSYSYGPSVKNVPLPPPVPQEPEALPPLAYPALARNVMLEIERRLPAPGEIMVQPGNRVEADTILGRTLVPQPPQLYDLTALLDLPPGGAARLVLPPVGSRVREGEVIAVRRGLRRDNFKAPFAATIAAFDTQSGYLSLTAEPQPFDLIGYVRGVVGEVLPTQGVKLHLRGSYVRGVFGLGGERHGVLKVLAEPNQTPVAQAIDARFGLSILVVGGTLTADVLRAAAQAKVRGIIAGSIAESELRDWLDDFAPGDAARLYEVGQQTWRFPAGIVPSVLPLTLIVTEGFGRGPMALPVFTMLAAYNTYEVAIDGTTRLRRDVRRPEVIIPAIAADDTVVPTPRDQVIRVGSLVRLLSADYLGATGRIVTIFQTRRPNLPGQLDRSAQVALDNGQQITLPLNDIEIVSPAVG